MRRISKARAKKLFRMGILVYFCPCKMHPRGPFSSACAIGSKHWIEHAERYAPQYGASDLWKGSKEETAWHLAYNNWAYYNTSWETGYYAHYYESTH